MSEMFCGAISFNQPLENWNVSNVKNMKEMFKGATSFNQPIENWNVPNVVDMRGMLYDANLLNRKFLTGIFRIITTQKRC